MTQILLYTFGGIAIIIGIIFGAILVLDVIRDSKKDIVNINADNAPHKLLQQLEPSTHVAISENSGRLRGDRQASPAIRN